MARMRYAEEAFKLLKQEDPDTQITLNFIRTLANSEAIPTVRVGGRRRLINYDALLDYLRNPPMEQPDRQEGTIRKVSLRAAR